MKTIHDLESEFLAYGLSDYYAKIVPFARNAIHLSLDIQEDNHIEIGASKFGGNPDLPEHVAWFRTEDTDVPMSFICQVNMGEVKPYDLENKLPTSGILYFFYDCSDDGMPWGFDPEDKAGKKVFFYDGDISTLQRKSAPKDLEDNGFLFGSAKMKFDTTMELPSGFSGKSCISEQGQEEQNRYWDMMDEQSDTIINKLLGHSDNIQGDMELECEYVTHGLYCGDATGYQEGKKKGLDKTRNRWNLLMQIDSNEELGMMWGDMGRLYLWITDADLENRAFDKSWLILQCG